MARVDSATLGLPGTRNLILNAERGFGMVLAGARRVAGWENEARPGGERSCGMDRGGEDTTGRTIP